MSVTGNFFGKLRALAITLEKETDKLEQAFNKDDEEYEDESPMRVLHDLRSEIKVLKDDMQATIDKKHVIGQELSDFIRVCKVLQQRTTSDIQQIKETFLQYGYTSPNNEHPGNSEVSNGNGKSDNGEQNSHDSELEDLPAMPTLEKQSNSWDILRGPQLSDFGLSHYQLPSIWEPQTNFQVTKPAGENPKPVFNDMYPRNVAKTPKCALRMEDDFSQIEHFGISDSSTNFNDDYTMALINKKVQKKGPVPDIHEKGPGTVRNLTNMLATPSHVSHRTDFDSVSSPKPPAFFTPGLKVHRKETAETKPLQTEDAGEVPGTTALSRNVKTSLAASSYMTLESNAVAVNSPLPPAFCTPGLKVHKKAPMFVETSEPSVTKDTATPPLPSFETNWLKSDTGTNPLDITEPIPRPELSHRLYLEDTATLAFSSDLCYAYPAKMASPPRRRNYTLDTPPRPEMTTSLTEELFKYNTKPSSPPNISGYENLNWTPARPEMTSCITEDISQILTLYCDNSTNHSGAVWENKRSIPGNREYKDKENR
ncbi:spindle and kinetochore-associated protein 3 [Pelodytes ibericus]